MAWSICMRGRCRPSVCGWWKRKLARPVSFTCRRADAALRMSSSRLLPPPGHRATPMLQVTVKFSASSVKGRPMVSSRRRAVVSAPVASACCTSSTNSSPPRRATVSTWRRQDLMRSVTSRSTRSPATMPSVSLTCLKRSRLITISAKGWPVRCVMASANSTRSASRWRLGRPVSASVCDSSSMRWRAASCSEMSRKENTRPVGWPRLYCGSVTRSSTLPECSVSVSLACSSAASRMDCRRRW
jgi:hypothetical protein